MNSTNSMASLKSIGMISPSSLRPKTITPINSSSSNLLHKSSLLPSSSLRRTNSKRKTQSLRAKPSSIRSMFTGIVEEMGRVKDLGRSSADAEGFLMKITADVVLTDIHLGDSISVNGTCLTVAEFSTEGFTIGLAQETLRKTSLVELSPGSHVNLERALLPSTRMGGHFVQGHVDGTGEIVAMEAETDSLWVKVRTSKEILKYIVPKGYIAVDGTSLTVVEVFDEEGCFNFMLVAYTQMKVVIAGKKVGQKVNLEVDILGKYVERLLMNNAAAAAAVASSSSS